MDKVVVITGATSGLGLSLSEKFVSEGDSVFGTGRTRTSSAGRFLFYRADLTKENQVKRLLSQIHQKAGKIDILINNAGYGGTLSTVENLALSEFQKHISANLFSVFLMCKYAIPIFKKQASGMIINVSSMAGKRAVPRLAAYSAAKFGVVALSQAIAKENQNAGFKCISVCPGGMETPMREKLFGREDAKKQQSPAFVAQTIYDIIQGKISVESGGDIVIRHGTVASINLPPPA